jgi:putative MFS transporter
MKDARSVIGKLGQQKQIEIAEEGSLHKLDQSDDNDLLLIDKITCRYGYGSFMWIMIICSSLIIAVSAYFTTFFSTTIIAYQKLFKLNDNDVMAIGTLYFIFKILGSMTVGQLTRKFDRVKIINLALLLLCVMNVLMSLFNDKLESLYATRVFTGYLSGTIETLVTNILCEHLPIQQRGLVLTGIWTGWSFGQILPPWIMLKTMPHYEVSGLKETIMYCSFIPFIALLLCLFFFEDSPRSYILNNKNRKAFKILARYDVITDDMHNQIVKEVKEGVNRATQASICELFKGKFLRLTIIILILNFFSNMLNDGFSLITSLTLNDVSSSKDVLKDAITVIVFSMPSCLISGALAETRIFGRKWTNFMGYIFLMTSIILAVIFPKQIPFFLGLYNIFINFGNILIVTYTSEIYPTKIRDMASSFGFTFSNIGSVLSQATFILLRRLNVFAPYYFIIGVCILCALVSYILPYETYHRPLDSNYNAERSTVYDDNEKNI